MFDFVNYSSVFSKVLANGEATELQRMPTTNAGFAMALWKERSMLFTVGGFNGSRLE